ncbi:SDR family NAD(P)-dependent oxidoreductase [Gracilibacillus alcaliphilus]|uniref:SDR family NAD(P)-dependent oxidoreductase n=1 Tax=Gracilibacillus alcaliphilus TaxID=1401441 RepID=UPI0019560942|nr:SDR family oxidoreductase [Gracilibacillus alcaliphilus]MBM7679413.1 NAD(P)-dependent dehydrogenase (short-subunit alcohol dehydrogenase family) [Gracilibacillus alcaliphilus]
MSIFAADVLTGRHVLITGATGGIGAVTAKLAVQSGAKVTITGRNERKLTALEQELRTYRSPEYIYAHPADITVSQERDLLIKQAEESLGFISDLVNAAGMAGNQPVESLEREYIEKLMDINYYAAFSLTKDIYLKMVQHMQGNIVNVASLSGLRGTYGNTAYASSKFAMIGWTQSMALEAIKYNIRVNAVCPGFVATEMAENILKHKAEATKQSFEKVFAETEKSIPSGRITGPEEVANTIIYLLTDAARNIVGESVKISGGGVMR